MPLLDTERWGAAPWIGGAVGAMGLAAGWGVGRTVGPWMEAITAGAGPRLGGRPTFDILFGRGAGYATGARMIWERAMGGAPGFRYFTGAWRLGRLGMGWLGARELAGAGWRRAGAALTRMGTTGAILGGLGAFLGGGPILGGAIRGAMPGGGILSNRGISTVPGVYV